MEYTRSEEVRHYNQWMLSYLFEIFKDETPADTAYNIAKLPCYLKLGVNRQARADILLAVRNGDTINAAYDPYFHAISAYEYRYSVQRSDILEYLWIKRPYVNN